MNIDTLENYRSNILFIQRITLVMIVIQLIVTTFHLFVPIYIEASLISGPGSIALGITLNLIGLLIAARMVDLDGERLTKLVRVICFGGLIHQHALGVNTIYTITIYLLALIGENLLIPKLYIIQRTQNFVSREKLTPEVYQAVSHADNYLEAQLKWITNTLLALIVVAVTSIFLITIFNILPALLPGIQVIQIIGIISLLGLFVLIIARGFPQFERPKTEYDYDYY